MKSILFVCVENSCRSQLAEAFARRLNTGNLAIHSAGSRPSGVVNPTAIEVMAELDYDLSKHQSKSLDDVPNIEYSAVITMGCGDNCPWVKAKLREDWALPDPKNLPLPEFRQIRDTIAAKVEDLINRLE